MGAGVIFLGGGDWRKMGDGVVVGGIRAIFEIMWLFPGALRRGH